MVRHCQMVRRCHSQRLGFTLVEVMMVVVIIGILAALIVPALNIALRSIRKNAIVLETKALESAVQQYKNKYGDFPPDGSSRVAWERHFRKAFPQIQASEFAILYANSNCNNTLPANLVVMDPAEAMVFCLGGFSTDVTHPFTGPGGPLAVRPGISPVAYQYNVDRTNAFFEFKQAQLSTTLDPTGAFTLSDDELTLGSAAANDLIPVYRPRSKLAPYVYFDSRTYAFVPTGASALFFNYYSAPNIDASVARPYKSGEINTNVAHTSAPDSYYKYAADRAFQIISAGLDDSYGGVPGLPYSGTPQFYAYPSGDAINITVLPAAQSGNKRYVAAAGQIATQLDNATSFAEGVLEDALEN
jgi:prepilin-type N-terminal cleavage/methylation domain-containing protein